MIKKLTSFVLATCINLFHFAFAQCPFQNTGLMLSNPAAYAVSNYAFTQNTDTCGSINAGINFTYNFPLGTDASTCTGVIYNGSSTFSYVPTLNTISFITPVTVATNTNFFVIFYGITNPECGGTVTSFTNPGSSPMTGSYPFVIFPCSTGVSVKTAFDFSIYPNPSFGNFYVTKNIADDNVEIFNVLGAAIRFSLNKDILVLDVPAGVYFLTNTKRDYFLKLIKE